MKLLYVTEDRFPPFRADVVELFAKQMPAFGHHIDWLMQRGPDTLDGPAAREWFGNTVYLTPRSKRSGLGGRIANNLLGMWGDLSIISLAIKGRYDVVQVRDKFFASLIARFAANLIGAKFVYWMSYPFAESKLYQAKNRLVPYHRLVWIKGQLIRLLLYRVILPLADHAFVQSRRMKDDVIREGVAADKLTPVPMGIRADQVGNASDARAPNTVKPLLLHLGIILRLRQPEVLVRALLLIRHKYPGARLCYVGEGLTSGDRQAVWNEANRLGLSDAVEVTGFLPMEEAWRYVKQADICFSPFQPIPVLLSTSPTKLIEYMAMAKCVVANEHPEQCEVLTESGVGHCVDWDEASFANEVCRLLENPEMAREMAARGPEWVRANRTYDVIGRMVNAQYASIVSPSRRVEA
jgi:glycosyltransferase involved in cell wall biosynthesis